MVQDALKQSANFLENREGEIGNFNTIELVRVEIDEIDTQLLNLLGRRMQCAQSIGAYKKQHNLPIVQVTRWQEILNAAIQKGLNQGLSDTFVTKFLTAIHEESIRHQTLIVEGHSE
jgi:chorismate mutase